VRKSWLALFALSLGLSLAVPLLYGGLDSLRALRGVPVWALAALLAMVGAGWVLNAARIRLLATGLGGRLGRRRALLTVIASEFAGVATPANVGNAPTYVLLLSRHGLTVGQAAAVVAVDGLTDLVFFATAIPAALLLFALDRGVSGPLRLGGLLLALTLLGVAALGLLLRHYRQLALWLGRRLHHTARLRRLRFRLARGLIQFRRAVQLLLAMGPWRLGLLYLYCVGHWMLRYGVLPAILWLMDQAVPWGYLFLMQGLLLFLGQLIVLPGGGGGVELGFGAMLAPYLDPVTSASVLLLWRFCTFYWYLLAGAPVFALLSGRAVSELARRST